MTMKPTQPQSIGTVLDTAFQLYKGSLLKVIPLSLIIAVASLVPYIYVFIRASSTGFRDPAVMATLMSGSGYWLAALGAMVLSTWGMAAMYARLDAIAGDESLTNGAALGIATSRLLATLIAFLLFALAVGFGLVALLIPGLILMVSLMLSMTLVIVENKGPLTALSSSHKLVWGHWWRTAAILTIGFIIFFVLYFAVMFVMGMAMPFVFRGGNPDDIVMMTQIFAVVLVGVVSLAVSPFYCALLLAIYYDLKLRKEGGDLAARVGTLNVA
jgi:hypothetical protein